MSAILAATDLSQRSDRAVRRALSLAHSMNLPCHIVSVIDDDQPDDLIARRKADVAASLERFVDSIAVPSQAVFTTVLSGDPLAVIPEQAEALDARLVVLGLHRIRPFLDLVRNTTMERLVRLSLRPVLLVRDPVDHDYRNILIPVSFSPSCAAAVQTARMIAPEAALRLFHGASIPFSGLTGEGPNSETARALRTEASRENDAWRSAHDFDAAVPQAEIITGYRTEIMMRLLAEHPDMIAVGANTRSGLNPYILGSFVSDLIRNPPCDTLVARNRP